MKRIPAGLLVATLVFTSPLLPRLQAEESAAQLEQQELGAAQNLQDESAARLSDQNLGPDQSLQDESADKLSGQDLGPDQQMQDESASTLAEKENLEEKPKVTASPVTPFGGGEGVDGIIYAAVAQPDGSVIVGGRFDNVDGKPRLNLARFLADGSLDPKFLAAPTDGVDGTVYALGLDAKGNLLVGGYFMNAQEQPLQNFVRYLASGRVDTSFAGGAYPNGTIYAIAVQPKGQIVIGGEFTQVGSAQRRNLARFESDGTLDGPLTAPTATTGAVRSLAALPGGGVLVGGELDIAGRTSRNLLIAP